MYYSVLRSCVIFCTCVSAVYTFFVMVVLCLFFFFKQKTADEMRISDWSSDVCSSDLHRHLTMPWSPGMSVAEVAAHTGRSRQHVMRAIRNRSEERRVGKSVSVRVDLGGRRIIKKQKKK